MVPVILIALMILPLAFGMTTTFYGAHWMLMLRLTFLVMTTILVATLATLANAQFRILQFRLVPLRSMFHRRQFHFALLVPPIAKSKNLVTKKMGRAAHLRPMVLLSIFIQILSASTLIWIHLSLGV